MGPVLLKRATGLQICRLHNFFCSDEYGAVTSLPQLFESLVLESVQLVKEAVLAIDNREDDILEHPTARANTELLLQKVNAFGFFH